MACTSRMVAEASGRPRSACAAASSDLSATAESVRPNTSCRSRAKRTRSSATASRASSVRARSSARVVAITLTNIEPKLTKKIARKPAQKVVANRRCSISSSPAGTAQSAVRENATATTAATAMRSVETGELSMSLMPTSSAGRANKPPRRALDTPRSRASLGAKNPATPVAARLKTTHATTAIFWCRGQ